jgi:cyclopropane fatty-acyl-phospholipid synthase-like methyltransferase
MSQAQSTEELNASLNDISVASWEANASFWDDHMGHEGNEFFNILEMPAVEKLTAVKEGDHILDLATGNGLLARRLANLGGIVRATDASQNQIKNAEKRTTEEQASRITYSLLDVTKGADFDRMIEDGSKVRQDTAHLDVCHR